MPNVLMQKMKKSHDFICVKSDEKFVPLQRENPSTSIKFSLTHFLVN